MKNADKYRPTKFVYRGDRLIASRDVEEVSVASRLNADLTAAAYDSALKTHATGRLLDLGCGNVPLYVAYKRFVQQVTCVDWASSAHSGDFLDVEADLTEPLPFEDAAFDTLILSDVLEHIPKPEPLWQEMHRVLAPGGKLLMNVPFYYCLHEQPHDFFRYTEFALRRFAEITGLAVLELRAVGGAKQVIADILAKKFVSWPGVGSVLASTVQWIGARGNAHGPSRMLKAESFPLGYFLVAQKPPATGRKSGDIIERRESQSEQPKRVVVYRNDLLPPSETFVRQQFTALTRWQGLLVGMHRSSPSLDLSGLNTRIFPLHTLPVISGACRRLVQLLALQPLLVRRWLAGLRPHLVHVHFGIDAVALWPAMRKLQIPMVVTLHGYDVNINTSWWEAGFGGRQNRFYHRDLVEMARDSRVYFVAVSQMIRHRAIQLGIPAEKVRVLHIGVDIEAFAPGPVPTDLRPSRILFVGRLVEKKGCDVLLRAVQKLTPHVPDVEVVIVGDGPLRAACEALAAKLEVNAKFTGVLSSIEVRNYLDSSAVLCVPSITGTNGDAEGLPIALLEAQASGVPVVTSAYGAILEALVDGVTGFGFPEGDSSALADRLERILNDVQLRTRMSKAAVEIMRDNFDLRKCTAELSRYYDYVRSGQRGFSVQDNSAPQLGVPGPR